MVILHVESDYLKIKNKFILFFIVFIILISVIFGLTGFLYVREEVRLFVNAPNKEFVSIMADKLLFKSFVSFIGLILIITSVSVIIGLYLFKLISNSFLKSVSDITGLAKVRVNKGEVKSETDLLKAYIDVLIEDQKKLEKFEKINSWKEGARLLIHEVKNPLTPLKLSLESMIFNNIPEFEDDLNSAIASTKDIEHILRSFKDLVNIEYGRPEKLSFRDLLSEYTGQISRTYPNLVIDDKTDSGQIYINSDQNLLKMVINNLIVNGMEANSENFNVVINSDDKEVCLEFITPDRAITDIDRCFVMGFSGKGTDRGYGLFLCKQISDYLDINIEAVNLNNDVIFYLKIKKEIDSE